MRCFLAIFILFLAASTAAAQVDDPAVSVVNVDSNTDHTVWG